MKFTPNRIFFIGDEINNHTKKFKPNGRQLIGMHIIVKVTSKHEVTLGRRENIHIESYADEYYQYDIDMLL